METIGMTPVDTGESHGAGAALIHQTKQTSVAELLARFDFCGVLYP